jgi:uncharacterized integral membrane protein
MRERLCCKPGIVLRPACASVGCMDKKQINSPKMTLNFLIWVGGVFMLLLFMFLAHFVWRIF